MKKLLPLIILIFYISYSYSQIGGISASKLATICTGTVGERSIEFEPVFGIAFTEKAWDENRKLYSLYNDSVQNSSEFGFRLSYGLFNNIELGIAFPVNLNTISAGIKYKLPFESKYSIALLSGFNMPIGNQKIDKRNKTIENTLVYVGGLVMGYDFTDKLGIDFDVQYQTHLKSVIENHTGDVFLNSDIGYYITDGFQLALGFNYSASLYTETGNNNELLVINPGFTLERAENFLIVIIVPFDVYGRNIEKSTGLTFALTITIN